MVCKSKPEIPAAIYTLAVGFPPYGVSLTLHRPDNKPRILNSLPITHLEGEQLPDVHGTDGLRSNLCSVSVLVCAGQPSLGPLPPLPSLSTGDQHNLSRSALCSKALC